MAIVLPPLPRTASVTPGLTDNAGRLTPQTGGSSQTIARTGNRYYAKVTIPALRGDTATARAWLAAQIRHKTELTSVRLAWPHRLPAGLPLGLPLVDGADQAGALLAVKGLTPHVVVPALSFFNADKAGRLFLHATTADVQADADGKAELPIGPMQRFSPADSAGLDFATPFLEGETDLGAVEWSLDLLRFVGVSFTITEIE